MSAIYLGRRVEPVADVPQVVALKIVRHDVRMDERMLKMFLEEGKLIARLVHPNIVRTLEVGGDGEQDYIAMELMLGKTFAAIHDAMFARDLRLNAEIAAWAAARVADALHYAHELTDEHGRPLGLVHRDVNPANIFATFNGEVKLFDFGLAKMTAGERSGSQLLAGKVSYLSPEQIMQMPLDRRSDIFSLGTTLWELLTGRRLFRRESDLETVRAVQLGPIPDPRAVAPEVPEELARIAKTALERNREHRYPTAAHLARDLDAFVFTRTSPNDVTARLAQLVDTLFPGEQRRQSGWLKPAISGPSRVSMPPPASGGRGWTSRPTPPPRSLSPHEITAVMPNAPARPVNAGAPAAPTSSPTMAAAPRSSPAMPESSPSVLTSPPRPPAPRPTTAPPPSPTLAAPGPDTQPHALDVTPRDGVPSALHLTPRQGTAAVTPREGTPSFSATPHEGTPSFPATPYEGTPSVLSVTPHEGRPSVIPVTPREGLPSVPPPPHASGVPTAPPRASVLPPPSPPREGVRPSMAPRASVAPPSAPPSGNPMSLPPPATASSRTSWPVPSGRSAPTTVPPPPQRARPPAPKTAPVPPAPPTDPIAPPPASRTEIQESPEPSPYSRTEIQAPAFLTKAAQKEAPATPKEAPAASKPSVAPTGVPLTGFVRPKRAPIPLPSRLKATESKRPPPPATTTTTTTTITEPPSSDTKVDLPRPPDKGS
jgi:serine/threonine-protein kinase